MADISPALLLKLATITQMDAIMAAKPKTYPTKIQMRAPRASMHPPEYPESPSILYKTKKYENYMFAHKDITPNNYLRLGDRIDHKQTERAQDAKDHMDGVHRVWKHRHCVDQKPPPGKELVKKSKKMISNEHGQHNCKNFTRIPDNIDDTVFLWYSGLNQRQLDRLSQIAMAQDKLMNISFVYMQENVSRNANVYF